MKLAIFDFDSTLMDGETLEFLAKEIGIEDKIKNITDKAMKGELDFFESLNKRVAFLKGMQLDRVNKICVNLPPMNGAKEIISYLQKNNFKVVCFSGGFKNATVPFAQKFNLDGEFSNILHSKNGLLTGLVGGEMMFNDSKGTMIQTLQKLLNIPVSDTITIGDGANDLSMFKYDKTKISFCGKPILEQNADIKIKEKDLSLIIDYLK